MIGISTISLRAISKVSVIFFATSTLECSTYLGDRYLGNDAHLGNITCPPGLEYYQPGACIYPPLQVPSLNLNSLNSKAQGLPRY
jgi:hypothetical protein